jgi:monoamine oxidase
VLKLIAVDAAKMIRNETCPWKENNQKILDKLKEYDNTSVKDALTNWHKVDPVKQSRLWKMLELKLVNDEVSPLDEMNYLGLLLNVKGGQSERFEIDDLNPMGYWDELEIFRCANGNQSLADAMAAEIRKNGGKLSLNTAVTNIDIRAQDVQLATRSVTGRKFGSAGASASFQYVVLAIPPSVWVDLAISDNGSALDLKTEIGDMGLGPAVKFFSNVKSRFWVTEKIPSAPSGGTLKLGQIWEGTDNQMQTGHQGIVLNIFAGPMLSDPAKSSHRPPTMAEMKKELRNLYPSYFDNLLTTLYSDWPNEPFIRTGYWTPKPNGEIFKVGPKLNIAFHKRLYFAGEHTHVSFFGYMEGALRSGIRAANLLMRESCSGITVDPCTPLEANVA